MQLSEILDRARTKSGASSERALARRLTVDPSTLLNYRRDGVPTDDIMVRICAVAEVPPEIGLAYLNLWRSRGTTRTAYRRIVKLLETAAPVP